MEREGERVEKKEEEELRNELSYTKNTHLWLLFSIITWRVYFISMFYIFYDYFK